VVKYLWPVQTPKKVGEHVGIHVFQHPIDVKTKRGKKSWQFKI